MARELSQPDVDALLAAMSARQFLEWSHLIGLDPVTCDVLDLHLASIRQVIGNYLRKSGAASFELADFTLVGGRERRRDRQQSIAEMHRELMGNVRQFQRRSKENS